MVCSKCGAGVNTGDNFCEECGASLKEVSTKSNSPLESFQKSTMTVCDGDLAVVTNIGRRHASNEDSGTALRFENGDSILIVSDGVSSSLSATSASQRAIDVIRDALVKRDNNLRELMVASIHEADACIKSLPYETREDGIYGPEATVVTAYVEGDNATIAWAGDSRAYVINEHGQELLTVDDSWVELVVAEGSMTREEAMLDKLAHCVTQVLGMHDQEVNPHLIERKLMPGDMLLLCSDGLWNYFQGENALLKAITAFGRNSDAVSICDHLVNLANSAGGRDNITAALLRFR